MHRDIVVIVSDSERGFWSNEQGWVYDVESATRWTREDVTEDGLPLSSGMDARYMTVYFDPDGDL